jgi:NADPH:quinone reductase-like Zn-dependent oxidoreductase
MGTMQAVRIHAYGGRDVLKLEQVPVPEVGDGDVLIRVHSTSVNPIEWKIRAGYLQGWLNFQLPWVLGLDVSGTVAEIGAKVTQFAVGDEVIARGDLFRSGSYAEYTAVDASNVTRKPKGLTHVEAGALPHASVTAWTALITEGQLVPGQTVLIHGGAGGVGTMAVQLAKCHGARVITTASPRNHELLRSLGADQVIDYNTVRFEDVVEPVDLVLDTIGGDTLQRSFAIVKPGGTLLSIVDTPSTDLSAAKGIQARQVGAQMTPGILGNIAHLVETNQLRVVVSTIFPLAELDKAHALSESMHARGKIAVKVID